MAKGNDPSQLGGVVGNRPKSTTPVRKPDGKQIIRNAGRDVAREDAKHTTPKHPVKRPTQDWRRG